MKKENKISVSKINVDDILERVKWLNHPDVYQYMNMQYPITVQETKNWYERIVSNNTRIDLVFRNSTECIAMTGLTSLDLQNQLVEFYIMVNPEIQGKGYGKMCTEFTINWAFVNYNINKVYLYTNEFNERANKLYLGLGFELEGTLRSHKFKGGKLIDRCVYGLLREDWEKEKYCNKDIRLVF